MALALLPFGMAFGPMTQDRPYIAPPEVLAHAAMLRDVDPSDWTPHLLRAAPQGAEAVQPIRAAAYLSRPIEPRQDLRPDTPPIPIQPRAVRVSTEPRAPKSVSPVEERSEAWRVFATPDDSVTRRQFAATTHLAMLVQPFEDYQLDPIPNPPAPPAIEVYVDISEQRLTLIVDGKQTAKWKVSTGARGHWTPTGVFTPFFLSRYHRSSIYNNAPMPYSVFFNGNIALHGTDAIGRLGRPASHGCIRLHPRNAKTLFNLVQARGRDNTVITVQR